MNAYVNKEAGKLYDLFSSIFIACNSEYYYEEIEKVDITIEREFKELINHIIDLLGDDIQKYKMYFTVSNIAYSLINFEKIWDLKDLDKYLEYINSINNYDIQKSILSFIDAYKEDWIFTMDDNKFKDIINDNNVLFKFLNDKDISYEEKWNIVTIINDIDGFKRNFISLIQEYELKYKVFIKKYEDDINKYADFLINEVKEKGINLDIPIQQMVDLKDIDTLFIIPSYFHAYTLSQTVVRSKHVSYMIIGKYVDKLFQATNRESSVDKYVAIFKNLSDLNRYRFIKILSKGEKYGQEIADDLNITSATVSYHANNLLITNLLKMERNENKTYYSLNKETLREMIEFIQNDLEL
ncbi:winged helix-turn-helix domain-containing protein [Tissierella sp.]|uniref:ArsR/SmtB family transcription factor n=1 Tax=Tissierella sp. TaxID=41274 RepID=UPI002862CD9B|nr:winged helix-turn-helix domain-containing protein [Tissierella sp.]MDR7857910.1 winged helix-turn-helix domain-containing protein [Tissierella sp.]